MGLDNGIMLYVKNEKDYKKSYCLFKHESWHSAGESEVAYWRKCRGIRNAILELKNKDDSSIYGFIIDLDNIDSVITTFKHFLHKKEWENEADSIWEWDKYTKCNQIKNLKGLKRLRRWLKKHPDDIAYFYDSY